MPRPSRRGERHCFCVNDSYLKQNENEKEKTKAGVAYLFKKLYF